MLRNKRPDGTPIKVPTFTKMLPYLMQTRTESTIYMTQKIEMDKALELMKKWNSEKADDAWPLTPMQIFLCACSRTVASRPKMNRFVSNRRHYQRNNISVSFVTKKELTDSGQEINVIMPFRPDDTLKDINERFARFIGEAKSEKGNRNQDDAESMEKLTHWMLRIFFFFYRWMDKHNFITKKMIRMLPFYASLFVTNVGSINLDAPLHHNFEIGNTGIFGALGKIHPEKVILEDNTIADKNYMTISYTFDDRIVDGIYSGRAMDLLKSYIEDPEQLLEKPVIDKKNLEELALTNEGWELWNKK